jgi:hypothetical protein
MDNIQTRYEKKTSLRPCCLQRHDLAELAEIIQEGFSKSEIERYFRVSTNIGDTRVFSNSINDFLNQRGLPGRISDLSFWMEGWGDKTRFDKVILLDFSQYSIQLSVEGIDPLWVYDKFSRLVKYMKKKAAFYWPMITMERFMVFIITMLLIGNIIVSISLHDMSYYLDKIALLSIWIFLVFYDIRKIWPYADIRLSKTRSAMNKESMVMIAIIAVIVATLLGGTLRPLMNKFLR